MFMSGYISRSTPPLQFYIYNFEKKKEGIVGLKDTKLMEKLAVESNNF